MWVAGQGPFVLALRNPHAHALSDHGRALRHGVLGVLKGKHAGKIGSSDDDEGDPAVVYLAEPSTRNF